MNKKKTPIADTCQSIYNFMCFAPFVALFGIIGFKAITIELGFTKVAAYLTSIGL